MGIMNQSAEEFMQCSEDVICKGRVITSLGVA